MTAYFGPILSPSRFVDEIDPSLLTTFGTDGGLELLMVSVDDSVHVLEKETTHEDTYTICK